MHIITITTNTASGGDFTSLTANECPDGWDMKVSDSCGLEFTLAADTLKELPDEEGLMKFIDAIRLDGEPSFKGLFFGFLEMNYGKGKLSEAQLEEAGRFIEVESRDFPQIALAYKERLTKWIEQRREASK